MEIALRRRWTAAVRSVPPGWAAAAVLLVALLAAPVLSVLGAAVTPDGGEWTHLVTNLVPEYLRHTAVLVALSGVLALVFGVGAAWLVAMCDFPGRRFFRSGLVLPLAVPAYIAAYTYAGIFDVTGPAQRAVRTLVPGMGDAFLSWNVMRIEVVAAIFGLVLYPYVYLPTRALFEQRLGSALEAARLLGRSPRSVFLRVGVPLARPAVAGGMALVLMEILNDYGAVQYYGVTTFTTGIFRSWFSLGDLGSAVRLSAMLMLVVVVVLALERSQRRGARYGTGGSDRPATPYALGGWKAAAATLFCSVPLILGFLVPATQLAAWALRTAPEVVDGAFLRMAANSFGLAAVTGVLALAIAVVLAYAGRLDRSRFTGSVSKVAVLGYSVPGAVIAVGVLVAGLRLDGTLFSPGAVVAVVSGTVIALVFAYLVRFMAVAYLPVEAGFTRIGESIPDAARTLGASPLRTLLRVELPLLRGPALAAVVLVVVDVLKELPLTLILRPFDFDTLATRAFQLASDEQLAQSAPSAILVIGSASVAIWLLHHVLDRGRMPA